MADLTLVTDNYLATASETFSDNLSGSISAGAAIVPVNSAAEYANGDVVVLTVEPGTANEATFVGVKNGNQFEECIWTEGNTGVGHTAGATIIDYDSATHYNLLSEALQLIMNQDGTLKDDPIRTALGLSDASQDGWEVFPYTFSVSSGYNKGNKEYDLTVANQDVTGLLSKGMKLRLERSTAAPTECLDLEASSSQYASRASGSLTGALSTFTDDITVEVWAKRESHALGVIVSRDNGASGRWQMYISSTGLLVIDGGNGTTNDVATAKISVGLDKWTHLAATLDMSGTTSVMYYNGVSVPVTYTNNGSAAITQSGDFYVGRNVGGNYFDGKLSDLRIWNVVRTATQIRDNMHQQLVGTESNLVFYAKLAGNLNDSTSSANNLTGSGGAVATNVDNSMHSTEYAIIHKITYSAPNTIITVFTGTDHSIPNMTLSSPYYSTQKSPYGFPTDRGKWRVEAQSHYQMSVAIGASGFATPSDYQISIPTGDWIAGYDLTPQFNPSVGAAIQLKATLATSSGNNETDRTFTSNGEIGNTSTSYSMPSRKERPLSLTAQTLYYLNVYGGAAGTVYVRGDNMGAVLFAESAYI